MEVKKGVEMEVVVLITLLTVPSTSLARTPLLKTMFKTGPPDL